MINNNDIIWKYRENQVGFLITLIHLLIATIFFCYLLIEGINKYLSKNDTSFFMTLLLLLAATACLYPSYRLIKLLNQKALYLTKKDIVFEKYIGKTIIAPLGVSYISTYSSMWGAIILGMSSVLTFNRIDSKNHKKISFILAFGSGNLEELYSYLLPKIETYLIGLQEKEYIECKISLNIDGKMDSRIDFDKIERLRKEKENGK
ncbi:hypothetical protein [Helicobacter trogontum]|uniref:Uncharacterized protein n=4 Tax=Helicobacter TaxID=209 RepID=A0A4U8T4Q4_9HELI|nr:hypothetical protein [Helicobacter trogontum]MCI5786164.1 hypothetical protein [Helicobacter trogontum]MDY5185770.1 hypothetical protein [Helicobacter trogontum]TLD94378.1 hypothetical protein LS80_010090 [Helicobacter trogontum]